MGLYSANLDNAVDQTEKAIAIARSNQWKQKEGYALMCHGIATY